MFRSDKYTLTKKEVEFFIHLATETCKNTNYTGTITLNVENDDSNLIDDKFTWTLKLTMINDEQGKRVNIIDLSVKDKFIIVDLDTPYKFLNTIVI